MYKVLYRKWRPDTFDDVAGQEHITATLKNELAAGRINHAYLFTGSRGTGKTSCAKIFAKAVNCLNRQSGNPCGECEICKGIDNESILDIVEMDAASNRKIDDIRDIIDELQFRPAKARYRVYIIDEVHMLTTEAFNALLKTLEEPPEHVIFILATTEVHKLPQTILSRCQRFDFHRIPPRAIADRLLYVASQEGISLSDEAAMLIASVADGALRDGLSLLDSCIAISSDVTEDVVRKASGLARKDYLFELCSCIINKNTARSLELIDVLYSESMDMARLCNEMISHFRSLMILKSVRNPHDFIIASESELELMQTESDYLSLADIVYYMDTLSSAYQRMGNADDRTELEMAFVKMSAPELDSTVEALTNRVAALEKAVRRGIAVTAQANTDSVSEQKAEPQETYRQTNQELIIESPDKYESKTNSEAPVAKAPPKPLKQASTQAVDLDEIYQNAKPFTQWVDVVNSLKPISRAIAAAFEASKAYESGSYMLIDTKNEMAFDLLRNSSRREEIKKSLFEITGKTYKLGPYKRQEKKEEKKNPLDLLKKAAEAAGIEVTEE